MSLTIQAISIIAATLFSYVILSKVGVPWFIAALLAIIAGYLIWRWENAESEDDPKWMTMLSSMKDLKDITKYVNQIF